MQPTALVFDIIPFFVAQWSIVFQKQQFFNYSTVIINVSAALNRINDYCFF